MPIPLICQCSAKLRIADDLDGERIQCPKCQTVYVATAETKTRTDAHFLLPSDPDEILDASGFSKPERKRLDDELEEGERLIWAKKAIVRSVVKFHFWISTIFHFSGLVFLIVVIAAWSHLAGMGMVSMFAFMIISFAIGIAWPFYQRARYVTSAYAITDRRVLIWSRDWFLRKGFKAYDASDLATMKRTAMRDKPEAVGHIIFAEDGGVRIGVKKIPITHGIMYVDNLRWLEKLIREVHVDAYTDNLYS